MLRSIFKVNCKRVNLSASYRYNNVWSVDRVVRSKFNDVIVPDLTVNQYVWKDLDKWADKTAVICCATKRNYTYEQVYKKSQVLGAKLRKEFKIQDGDSVALMMSNVPEYAISVYGVLAAGGVASLMNPIYTAHEVHKLLEVANPKLFIVTPEAVNTVKAAFKLSKIELPIISFDFGEGIPENTVSFKEFCEDEHVELDILKLVKRKPEDVAILPFSSGTTGLPKAVQLTNANFVANCEQQNSEMRQYSLTTGSNQDSVLGALPFFHSFGLSIVLLHKMSAGLQIVLLPRFKQDFLAQALADFDINLMYLVPPMILHMSTHPEITSQHFRKLNVVTSGAAPLLNGDRERFFDKIGREINFTQGYGLTETSPLATLNPLGTKNHESSGYAIPNVTLRVVDQNSQNLGPNEVGELLIKGPNVMKGYKNNPEANNDVFVDDKWFKSGDLAKIDENGSVYIVGRLKELIKVNAFQVPPAELENILKDHPDVLDVAVIGVPDEKTGEKPKAIIIRKNNQANEKEILDFVAKRVAPYKRLKEVAFVDSIPKNPSGKILRRVLVQQFSKNK